MGAVKGFSWEVLQKWTTGREVRWYRQLLIYSYCSFYQSSLICCSGFPTISTDGSMVFIFAVLGIEFRSLLC